MIKLFEQYNEYNQVRQWLDCMRIKDYVINDDLTVDVKYDVQLMDKELVEIPIQFGKVNGSFDIGYNILTSLKGCPNYVGGEFVCTANKLTTLEYSPRTIMNDFYCQFNQLTTLEGAPDYVGVDFYCHNNILTSLKGYPKYIGDDFYCHNNQINTLKYISKDINGDFLYHTNNLPTEIYDFKGNIIQIIKYQEDYGIWNDDETLNKGRWNIFVKDFYNDLL